MDGLERVIVQVPATSANLGTGFDAVGVAVQIYAIVTVGLGRQHNSPGDSASAAVRRMVRAGVRAAFRAAGAPDPGDLGVAVESDIPLARGLGASAAARGAGLVAGDALSGGTLSSQQLLDLGTQLEGHADNIAPALFGGCQVAALEGGSVVRVALPFAKGLRFVGFVPSFTMPTQASRELLPDSLSRADVIHQSARSALLVAALVVGRWEALRTAVDDRLHQRPRSALFPALFDFINAAEQAGAWAAYLSGGGSTVMALCNSQAADAVHAAFDRCATERGIEGYAFRTQLDQTGARIIEPGEGDRV